jgi:hypothetical protein
VRIRKQNQQVLQPQYDARINRAREIGVHGAGKTASEISDFKLYAEDHKRTVAAMFGEKNSLPPPG